MKALIVESDSVLRAQLEQSLREQGHEVTACADFESGWSRATVVAASGAGTSAARSAPAPEKS